MSAFTGGLNSAGAAFVLFAARMGVQASVLILALVVLDLVLRRRVTAVVRYWIWLLVLAKLILPPSLSSPTSLAWWLGDTLPEARMQRATVAEGPAREDPLSSSAAQAASARTDDMPATTISEDAPWAHEMAVPAQTAASDTAPTWQALVLVAWLAVVAVMLVLLMQRALFVRGLVHQSEEAPERLLDLLVRCRRQMGVRTPVRLRLMSVSASPSVCGLVRPTILVPQRMLTRLDHGQLRSILLHELAHVQRADLWVNLAQTLLQIAYVYHPLVWLANAIIRKVREQAVDETVLAAMGDEAEEYPRTLLTVSKLAFDQPALSLRLVGVVESRRTLTARIRHIVSRPFPRSAKLGCAGLVLVLVVGAALLPMAKARHTTQTTIESAAVAAPAGIVVDEKGNPMPGAHIVLYYKKSNRGLGNTVVEETRTDAQGRFALAKPLTFESDNGTTYTDHYLLFALHPDRAIAWQVIVGKDVKTEHRLTMTEPVTQQFRVTDREGTPLPQARVWIAGVGRDDDANPLLRPSCSIPDDIGLLTTTTDDEGRATLAGLPRTSCSFRASMPGYSHRVILWGVPSQGETHVEMTRAGTATGHVRTPDGKPVVGAQLSFQADWGEWYFEYATTDETGRFFNDTMVARGGSWVEGGGSGQYKVTIRHPDFTAPELVVQLEPGQKDEFDIEAVEGTLLRVHALEPETERPIAGARIGGSSTSGRLDGYTDANGLFERRVLNGDASAFFYSPPGGTYIVRDNGGVVRTLAKGGVEDMTVYAPSRLYPLVDIKGRLLLPDGSPAAGLRISTTNNVSTYHTASWGGTGGAYARTNADGSFDLKEVPREVELFVYAETKDHKYVLAEVLDPAQASPELAQALVMREGSTASLVLADASGKPRVNMAIKLRPRKWEHYLMRAEDRPASTDAEGRLTLDGIVPGLEYFVRDARANLGERGWWDLYNENRALLPQDSGSSAPTPVPSAALKASNHVAGTKDAPDPRALLDRYREAATGWDKSVSMRVEYDHSMNYRNTDIRRWKYDITHRRNGDRCEWFGRYQFEGKDEGRPYSFNEEFRDLVSDDYFLHHSQRDSGGERETLMGADVRERLFMLQAQSADGGFLQGRTGGIGTATHHVQVMCDSNDVRYIGQETLGGTPCHRVEARTKYGTFTAWLAPEKGYNAVKSIWSKSGRDILRDNIRIEDQGIVEWTETLDEVDVQRIDGVFVPVSGRLTGHTKFTDGETSEDHTTVRRSEIVLHPDFQALEAFQIVLPEGTAVRLEGVAEHQFRWSNGKFTPDLFKYLLKSLLGRPLPALDSIRTDLDVAQAGGKVFVLCFFDMQQRSSRNCMVQLSQKAELLADRGAVILGAHTAKVQDAALADWLQRNGIRVPVGTVRADEEQTRCAWGVRSLPWLILTDRNHVVRAEGFDLSELQHLVETIGQMSPSLAPEVTGTTLAGVIVDAAGKPIAGAYATLENLDLLLLPEPVRIESQTRRVMRANGTPTNAQGEFRFTDLAPGKTGVSVRAPGYRTEFARNLSTGTENLRIVLGEPRPYRLSGNVVDTSCKGLEGVEVTFIEETLSGPAKGSDAPPLSLRTDQTGAFQIGRVLPPVDGRSVRRSLFARKEGYGAWGQELDTTGGQTSLHITLQAEERVSGVVKDEAGQPIAGAAVSLNSGRGSYGNFWFPPARLHLAPQATTQADGAFTLDQLPTESDLSLRVQAEGYASGELLPVRTGRFGSYAVQTGNRLQVMGNTSDPNAPLVITLQRAVTLRGTVVYEKTGAPAPAIRVATQAQRGGTWSETVTDAAGRFDMTGVSPVPCNLLVMADAPARDTLPAWTAAAIRLNDLRPGETREGLKLVLTKGDLVRGRVADAQDQPLKGIDIAFYSAARPRPGAACQSILTAADGTWAYRFPPGEVYIYIRERLPGAGWKKGTYTYNLTAGQTIENVNFVLNQAVSDDSRYKGTSSGMAAGGDRKFALPSGATPGPATEWPISQGGNGHFYQPIRMPKPLPWKEANEIAGKLGGYLVTITSKAENDFVFHLIDDDTYWFHSFNWRGPWIGALQPPGSKEPDGGWSWVTGEPFTYALWDEGQPNNFRGSPENRLVFGNQRSRIPTWNDVLEDFPEVVSFVVEWNERPSANR